MKRVLVLTWAVAFGVAIPTGRLIAQTTNCPVMDAEVSGQVRGAEGRPMLVYSSMGCPGTVTSSSFDFSLRTAAGRQILYGRSMTHCIEPLEVDIETGQRVIVELEAVDITVPHASVIVHGSPWVPKGYRASRCELQNRFLMATSGVEGLDALPQIPTPDSVLGIMAHSDVFTEVWGEENVVALAYMYGTPTDSSLVVGDRRFAVVPFDSQFYVLVRRVTAEVLDLQAGRLLWEDEKALGIRAEFDLRTGASRILEGW